MQQVCKNMPFCLNDQHLRPERIWHLQEGDLSEQVVPGCTDSRYHQVDPVPCRKGRPWFLFFRLGLLVNPENACRNSRYWNIVRMVIHRSMVHRDLSMLSITDGRNFYGLKSVTGTLFCETRGGSTLRCFAQFIPVL